MIQNGRRPSPAGALEGLAVERIAVPYPHDSPLTPLTLKYFLRGRGFDVFHSPYEIAPLGLSRPMVVTVHDINWIVDPAYNSNNWFLRRAGGFFYRNSIIASMNRAARIIAISNATRDAILELFPEHESKLRVVHNGPGRERILPIDEATASRTLKNVVDPGVPYVLTVGQGSPYKNHVHAVRGFLQAFRDRPDYRMVLVRRFAGADRELDRLLRTPQAKSRVIVLPYVTPDVLNALYNRARILLHPSFYEGFGLPLVEAMTAGLPIVTSNLSAMPEVVGPAALLVDPGDDDAIAGALMQLDRDEILREKLIAAGRQRLEAFDWTKTARATLGIYRDVASAGNSAAQDLR